jgi:uncharacterized protein YbjT (DUF2867 family)
MDQSAARKVVLLGATGAVGGHVLAEVLGSPVFAAVTTLGRRPAAVPPAALAAPGKLAQHVVDVATPESYRQYLPGHSDAICTLGVGDPSKMPREEVWRIEVDYVVAFASACRQAGIERFSLMTSVGSDPASRSYFLKMKGTLEEQVKALGFPRLRIFRPSMILTPENRYGLSQAVTLAVWPKLNWALQGPLRSARGIRVEDLGRAIGLDAARGGRDDGTRVYTWDDFQAILKSG